MFIPSAVRKKCTSHFKAADFLIYKISHASTLAFLVNKKHRNNELISAVHGSFFSGESGKTAPEAQSCKVSPGAALLQDVWTRMEPCHDWCQGWTTCLICAWLGLRRTHLRGSRIHSESFMDWHLGSNTNTWPSETLFLVSAVTRGFGVVIKVDYYLHQASVLWPIFTIFWQFH